MVRFARHMGQAVWRACPKLGEGMSRLVSSGSSLSKVLIYYHHDGDDASLHGWWFGPDTMEFGTSQNWAFNSEAWSFEDGHVEVKNTTTVLAVARIAAFTARGFEADGSLRLQDSVTPPLSGWHVPWNGPVDPAFKLTEAGRSAIEACGSKGEKKSPSFGSFRGVQLPKILGVRAVLTSCVASMVLRPVPVLQAAEEAMSIVKNHSTPPEALQASECPGWRASLRSEGEMGCLQTLQLRVVQSDARSTSRSQCKSPQMVILFRLSRPRPSLQMPRFCDRG